jgi:hypothetical protein
VWTVQGLGVVGEPCEGVSSENCGPLLTHHNRPARRRAAYERESAELQAAQASNLSW